MNKQALHLQAKPPEIEPEIPPDVQREIEQLREQIAFHARKGRVTFHATRLNQILALYHVEE